LTKLNRNVNVDANQVIGRLASKIANLEIQLAQEQALNDELNKQLKELKEEKAE